MDAISVAVALPSGEMASGIIASTDHHPLLDLCGVARSVTDLLRLLDRTHPDVLMISPSLLDELEPTGLAPRDATNLNAPLSFLISEPGASWGDEELARMLRFPLTYCGLIACQSCDGNLLFHIIKEKFDISRRGEGPLFSPLNDGGGGAVETGLITVTGSKGGVGSTLVTCALAATLSRDSRRVLLMEMDRDLSQLLYLKPRDEGKTLLDLLPMAEDISWDLIRVSVHRHEAGFHLLPYGRRFDDGPGSDIEVPGPLLRNLLFLFDTVIQDYPGPLGRDFLPLLQYSPSVLLVSLPDTLTATCARHTAAFLRRTGLDADRMGLIVNRCGANHTLRPDELARAAGIDLLATLPDDPRSGLDFAELGVIPSYDSPLGRAVAVAAARLGFTPAPAGKVSALRRLFPSRSRREHDLDYGSLP
jgi:MinD-like ATPase involved in chromosome partitioning or flagellar assembly